MGNHRVDDAHRIRQHVPVTWRDGPKRVALQPLQRIDVRGHVAIGREDHGRHPIENMIAREQQPLVFEQVADVIRSVTRGVDGTQPSGA
jgi:hypothetical protein